MLTFVFLGLLWTAPFNAAQAETFAAAGQAHLDHATSSPEHPLDEFQSAHTNFDLAYLLAEDTRYLCRALAVAELALRTATFADIEERRSWEETQRDDLQRLQREALETVRGNCRFDAKGAAVSRRVALLTDDDAPARPEVVSRPTPRPKPRGVPKSARRRFYAQAGVGTVLSGAGLGLLGVLGGVLEQERQRAAEMRGLIGAATAEERRFTVAEDRRFRELAADLLQGRDVAIGVGVAGLVSVATGVALLATLKKSKKRGYALQPYGGPQGDGAVFRLKF